MAVNQPGHLALPLYLYFWLLCSSRVLRNEPSCSDSKSLLSLTQEAWTRLPVCSAHKFCHSVSEPSSHTAEPGALHLSWGGWGPHAKTGCGSSGRTCPWALMLRDKGTRQEKTPHVETKIKSEAVLPNEDQTEEARHKGNQFWGNRTEEPWVVKLGGILWAIPTLAFWKIE